MNSSQLPPPLLYTGVSATRGDLRSFPAKEGPVSPPPRPRQFYNLVEMRSVEQKHFWGTPLKCDILTGRPSLSFCIFLNEKSHLRRKKGMFFVYFLQKDT